MPTITEQLDEVVDTLRRELTPDQLELVLTMIRLLLTEKD